MSSKYKPGALRTYTTSNGKHIVVIDTSGRFSPRVFKDGFTWFRRKKLTHTLPGHVKLFQDAYWISPCITDCFVDEPFMVDGRVFIKVDNVLREVDRRNILSTLQLCNKDIEMLLTKPRQSMDLLQFCNEYVANIKVKRAHLNHIHFNEYNKIKYEPISTLESLKRFCDLANIQLPFSDAMLLNSLNVL